MGSGHCGAFVNIIFGRSKMSKQKFNYSEIDNQGLDTLKIIAESDKLNEWIYNTIKPSLKGRILEIGSGIGNLTSYAVENKLHITASDIRDKYCEILSHKFYDNTYVEAVRKIDISHADFEKEYHDLINTFDTVFAINIIEHIENDMLAIQNCRKLLKNEGKLIILVPANPLLYNRFDIELKHFRRYTKKSLVQLLTNEKFNVSKIHYFNFIGILGWWFSGSILKKRLIPLGHMRLYNKLVPLGKMIDKITFGKMGLSLIAFADKEGI